MHELKLLCGVKEHCGDLPMFVLRILLIVLSEMLGQIIKLVLVIEQWTLLVACCFALLLF